MMFMKRVNTKKIREMYPKGTIIELEYMDDPQAPPRGTKGEVMYVDDIGQVHMKWENGSGLALNVEYDKFHTVK